MLQHAITQPLALAHVEKGFVLTEKAVDPGAIGNVIQEIGRQLAGHGCLLEQIPHHRLEQVRREAGPHLRQETHQHFGIAECPMPGGAGQPVACNDRIKIVAPFPGKQATRELDRAKHRHLQAQTETTELRSEESIVEARVVGHEQPSLETRQQVMRDFRERGRVGDRLVGDAGERLDPGRDAASGMHECAVTLLGAVRGHRHHAHLDDAVVERIAARGLEIDADVAFVEHQPPGRVWPSSVVRAP